MAFASPSARLCTPPTGSKNHLPNCRLPSVLANELQQVGTVFAEPVFERERCRWLIEHGLARAGCTPNLLRDLGLEMRRRASRGLPEHAARIVRTAMRLATLRGFYQLPGELLRLAREQVR